MIPEYFVSGHIWYSLPHSRRTDAENEEHAREMWQNPPLDFEIEPDTFEYDDSEVESVTRLSRKPRICCVRIVVAGLTFMTVAIARTAARTGMLRLPRTARSTPTCNCLEGAPNRVQLDREGGTMSYVHDSVTNKILEQFEQGVVPWRKRWQLAGPDGLPRNLVSDRPYSGINIILLWLTSLECGYGDRRWLTFNQVKELGGKVKGQSATRIIFAGQGKKTRDDGEEETYTCVKFYNVFNAQQVEGLELEPDAEAEPFEVRLGHVRDFVAAQSVPIIHGGNQAFYSPTRDVITLPPQGSFFDEEGYWATALHELAHATGHPSRLGRVFGKRGTPEYAREELVAELACCFTCAELGMTPSFEDSASYLSHWCELLGDSKTAIFQAAREASRVSQYLQEQTVPLAVAA